MCCNFVWKTRINQPFQRQIGGGGVLSRDPQQMVMMWSSDWAVGFHFVMDHKHAVKPPLKMTFLLIVQRYPHLYNSTLWEHEDTCWSANSSRQIAHLLLIAMITKLWAMDWFRLMFLILVLLRLLAGDRTSLWTASLQSPAELPRQQVCPTQWCLLKCIWKYTPAFTATGCW